MLLRKQFHFLLRRSSWTGFYDDTNTTHYYECVLVSKTLKWTRVLSYSRYFYFLHWGQWSKLVYTFSEQIKVTHSLQQTFRGQYEQSPEKGTWNLLDKDDTNLQGAGLSCTSLYHSSNKLCIHSFSLPPQVVHSVYVDIYRCTHVYVYIPTLINASVCLRLEGENPIVW